MNAPRSFLCNHGSWKPPQMYSQATGAPNGDASTTWQAAQQWGGITPDPRSNTAGPQNSYAERQKPEEQCTSCVIPLSYTSRKYKEIYSETLQIGGCLVTGVQGGTGRGGWEGQLGGDDFRGLFICQNLSKDTLQVQLINQAAKK